MIQSKVNVLEKDLFPMLMCHISYPDDVVLALSRERAIQLTGMDAGKPFPGFNYGLREPFHGSIILFNERR